MMQIVADTTLSRRIDRVVSDVLALLHDDGEGARERAMRWVAHVLNDASLRQAGPWWFLKKRATATLGIGADVIDLRGDIEDIVAVYAPGRLQRATIEDITNKRATAAAEGAPNAGTPSAYAIEAGNVVRLHLWPSPAAAVALQVLYTRPLDLAIVPAYWETLILNGVIGQFGRHFDRDQLTADPAEFEKRYERQLRAAAKGGSRDIELARAWDALSADSTVAAASTAGTTTSVVVPASQTGIGYVTIETGDYPLTVG